MIVSKFMFTMRPKFTIETVWRPRCGSVGPRLFSPAIIRDLRDPLWLRPERQLPKIQTENPPPTKHNRWRVFFLLLCSEYFYLLIFKLWWCTIAGSYIYIPELLLGIVDQFYNSHIRVLGVVCLRKAHGCISYKINNLRSISQGCVGPKEMVSYHQVHDLYLPLAPSFCS